MHFICFYFKIFNVLITLNKGIVKDNNKFFTTKVKIINIIKLSKNTNWNLKQYRQIVGFIKSNKIYTFVLNI